MPETKYQSDMLSVIKRRPVGKGAWKVTINELIESERDVVATLRSIRHRHAGDAATQADVAAALDSITEILIKLGELLHYKEGGCASAGGGAEVAPSGGTQRVPGEPSGRGAPLGPANGSGS